MSNLNVKGFKNNAKRKTNHRAVKILLIGARCPEPVAPSVPSDSSLFL
jgi:hypothetical protein